MEYSNFSLTELKQKLNLTLVETTGTFEEVSLQEPSEILETILRDNFPLALAINTEKARSELLISPLLVEIRNLLNKKISLFSGIEFNIEPTLGLNGVVDFLISRSPQQLTVEAPVVVLVEAKKENLNAALPQCIAEMIAAQQFNTKQGNNITPIYGIVTTGSAWKFLQVEASTVTLDLNEYYISSLNKILGILVFMSRENNPI